MNRSESIKELVTALSVAQGKIGAALKDTKNEFFKSKYADLASVVDAIKDPLSSNGLSYTQVLHDANNAVCVETVIFHKSGEWMSTGQLTIPVVKHDAQGFGSALTYARRYSLSAAFGVAPEEDDGNAAANAKPANKNTPVSAAAASIPPVNEEDQAYLQELAASLVHDVEIDGNTSLAFDKMEEAKLDSDQKILLWNLLAPNSKTRAALKKEGEARRSKHQEEVKAERTTNLAEAM